MKTRSMYRGISLLVVALTTVACQNELNEKITEPKPGEKINMTICATQATTPQTRTSYEDKLGAGIAGSVIVKWEGKDGITVEKIRVFGYDAGDLLENSVIFDSDPSSISSDGTSITFSGTIESKSRYLAMYPADKCIYNDDDGVVYTSFSGQTQDCTKPMAHIKDYDFMVGAPVVEGEYDDFTFTHEATMLRFVLNNVPSSETITKVSLTTTNNTLYSQMYTTADVNGAIVETDEDSEVSTLSLNITNHTPSSTPLKAYMMIPPCNLINDELTITVATTSGTTYEGKLTTKDEAEADLKNGKCYTLEPTLAPINVITIPSVTEGSLGASLTAKEEDISASGMTKLALEGEVNDTDDFSTLVSFLNVNATNITVLDLSGLTNVTEVKQLENCTNIETVILPDEAEAIGKKAFKGCKALTTIIQNENGTTKAQTRASMPKKVKTVGVSAFENCTSITEMFLHAGITNVGNNAFKGCSSMTALVFEHTNGVAGITLGTGIIDGTHKDLKIFLPAIADLEMATSYQTALGKPTYYTFKNDYSKASSTDKVNTELYTPMPEDGSTVPGFTPGGEYGSK